jgi:hypothetical protein
MADANLKKLPALSYREVDNAKDFEFGRRLHHTAYKDVVTRQFGLDGFQQYFAASYYPGCSIYSPSLIKLILCDYFSFV